MTSTIYAEISIDEMDSLLKDDSLIESGIGSDGKDAREDEKSSTSGTDPTGPKAGSSSGLDEKAVGNSVQSSLAITVVVAVFAVIFIGVIFLLYAKTKKLVDDAQISKDLAEKYFYNVQEYKESFERIKREIDLSLAAIDKGTENIDKEINIKVEEKLNGLDNILAAKMNILLKGMDNRDFKPEEHKYVLEKAKPSISTTESLQVSEALSSETISEPTQNEDEQFIETISEPIQNEDEQYIENYCRI